MASRLLLAARHAARATRAAAAATASLSAHLASADATRAAAAPTAATRASRAAAAATASLSAHVASANATRASRAAAAAPTACLSASVVGADASRGSRLGLDNILTLNHDSCFQTKRRDDAPPCVDYFSSAEYKQLQEEVKYPTHKDVESDEAIWALYERWCKAFDKERDHADMARRFKLFKFYATQMHRWNTRLPADPKKAAIYIRKREKVKSLLSKGQDVSNFDEKYKLLELGPLADGGDPFITERNLRLMKAIDKIDAVEDVITH